MKQLLGGLAAALLVAGLALGLVGVNRDNTDCGSVIIGANQPRGALVRADCAAALAERRAYTLALLGAGLVLLFTATGGHWRRDAIDQESHAHD